MTVCNNSKRNPALWSIIKGNAINKTGIFFLCFVFFSHFLFFFYCWVKHSAWQCQCACDEKAKRKWKWWKTTKYMAQSWENHHVSAFTCSIIKCLFRCPFGLIHVKSCLIRFECGREFTINWEKKTVSPRTIASSVM